MTKNGYGGKMSARGRGAPALLAIVVATVIFAADLALPAGILDGAPYVLVVFFSLWMAAPRWAFVFAGGASGLAFLAPAIAAGGAPSAPVLFSRAISVAVVLISAVFVRAFWRVESERRRTEEWVRTSFEHAPSGMAVTSPDGHFLHVNPALCRFLGYSAEELRQMTWADVTHPDDYERSAELVRQLLAGEIPVIEVEKRYRHKDGSCVCGHVSVSLVRDDEGRPLHRTVQIVDITRRVAMQEQLRASERYFRSLIENALDVITVLEADGTIRYESPAIERVLGYTSEERIGTNAFSYLDPDDAVRLERLVMRGSRTSGAAAAIQFRARHKDGSWRYLEAAGRNLLDDPAVAGIVVNSRDITERKAMERALRESRETLRRSHQELQSFTGVLMTAAEEERARLARELHDDLNQRLAALSLELGQLRRQKPFSAGALAQRLAGLEELVGQLSDDVRNMAYRLHPATLDYLGLEAALDSECDQFSAREGIAVELKSHGLPEELPRDVSLCLYRVAQESLRNVARHARSDRARVTVTGDGAGIRLCVEDFGQGFNPVPSGRGAGLGIISMAERVRLVGGQLTVRSEPGKGTRVEAWVPVSKEVSGERQASRATGR